MYEYMCMSQLVTQCISNSQRIRADSARVDWSNAVQASSVQLPKHWGLVRSRSKNFLDWTWTRLDGSSPDWYIAGLVESLSVIDVTPVNREITKWSVLDDYHGEC
jgi:hypothetical protein